MKQQNLVEAAAAVAQSVKCPELRSLKRGTTELTQVRVPAASQEVAKIPATPFMRQTFK